MNWLSSLLLAWPKKGLDLLRFTPEPDHRTAARTSAQARGQWKAGVNKQGWIGGAASFRARDQSSPVLGTRALPAGEAARCTTPGRTAELLLQGGTASEAVQLHKKTSPRAGSPWASTPHTHLVTSGHYFQNFWRQTWQQVFLRKLQPQDPVTPTAEEHNLSSPQDLPTLHLHSSCTCYWPLLQTGSTARKLFGHSHSFLLLA